MNFWFNINFQNGCSFLMIYLKFLYNHMMILLVLIMIFISFIFWFSFKSKMFNNFIVENENMELFWIILPTFMLLFIAGPSMKLLYFMEEIYYSSLNIKVIGYQWYWTYQYLNNFNIKNIDMFMEKSKIFRLMETSNYLILPTNMPIQILTTSNDVIHSWTIPALNIKSDSIPGRINQINLIINKNSILIGQCSEICGMNHSFMPINIRSLKF